MKNFIKGTLAGSLLLSLLIHFGLIGSATVDWHLREQWEGLKSAVSQITEKINKKTTATEKAQELLNTAKTEISESVDSVLKGKKLRFGPDSSAWKQLDERILAEKKQQELEAKNNAKKNNGGGKDSFERFISPPVEVELVEVPKPPKEDLEKGPVIEMQVDFKKEECKDQDPKVKTYGGIGLQFAPNVKTINGTNVFQQPLQFKVSLVPKGYPADKAGIMAGDIIEGDPLRFRGEIGSMVKVDIIRNGKKISYNLKRVKICYEAPVPVIKQK